jgi:glutamate-1-semialdehyde aminotransferase/spore coat polysaccharide biosynthesis protein SpsF (cytidylyltransferase family)
MINNLKVLCVIQARMSSKRLPNKALADLNGIPVIIRMINRIKLSKLIDTIVIATGVAKENDTLESTIKKYSDIDVYRGDDIDVLSRYVDVAKIYKADFVIRLTGDCPLIDSDIIDKAITLLNSSKSDYTSNITKRTFPDGLDVEVFKVSALLEANRMSLDSFSREHVTTYMHGLRKNKKHSKIFKITSLENSVDFSNLRWTLDEQKDLDFLNIVFKNIDNDAPWMEIISFLVNKPEIQLLNKGIKINEGSKESVVNLVDKYENSNNFFKKVSSLIPLASQTFSKSYMQWPKGSAPLFVERAYGEKIVDIDGNHYTDYILGLLPITLGYCDKDVDAAVINQVIKGSVYSLPSTLEYELAEKLVNIIPSAEMVRFGKNGSDVTTAAVRLSRAYTNRDMIAVAGYHGWHDWYIGSSTRDVGVPDIVKSLTHKFIFNDADSLKSLFKKYPNKFAAVILEPAGLVPTDINFLKTIKKLCKENGTLLIFDEIISGFRINMGGAQLEYGVKPDLSCFGKGIANGYPLSAIVGSKKIMKLMEEIFFSSTFGGETISLAASIATIDKMEKNNVVKKTRLYGKSLIKEINKICELENIKSFLRISSTDWWPQIIIDNPPIENFLFISLLRQELLNVGIMVNSTFNLCYSHTRPDVLEDTTKKFREAILQLKIYLNSNNPKKYLKGELIQITFKVR